MRWTAVGGGEGPTHQIWHSSSVRTEVLRRGCRTPRRNLNTGYTLLRIEFPALSVPTPPLLSFHRSAFPPAVGLTTFWTTLVVNFPFVTIQSVPLPVGEWHRPASELCPTSEQFAANRLGDPPNEYWKYKCHRFYGELFSDLSPVLD